MTVEQRLSLVLFSLPQNIGSMEQTFNWVNGFCDNPQVNDPTPANLDSDWDWVSKDEFHFYVVEEQLFPSGNSSA